MTKSDKTIVPIVKIAHKDYQPNKAELQADARLDATFEEVVDVLVRRRKSSGQKGWSEGAGFRHFPT